MKSAMNRRQFGRGAVAAGSALAVAGLLNIDIDARKYSDLSGVEEAAERLG